MTIGITPGHAMLQVTQMYEHAAEAHVRVEHTKASSVDGPNIETAKKGSDTSV